MQSAPELGYMCKVTVYFVGFEVGPKKKKKLKKKKKKRKTEGRLVSILLIVSIIKPMIIPSETCWY